MPTIRKTGPNTFRVKHTTREVWGVDDPSIPAEKHTAEEFDTALAGFLAAAQTKVQQRYVDFQGRTGKIETESGPKYIRVISAEYLANGDSGGSRSAFCFIERETGDVLKPAGWKGPEKRNPRSNIFADDFGASGVTGYGTTYLR
jgi:hypothetical protein